MSLVGKLNSKDLAEIRERAQEDFTTKLLNGDYARNTGVSAILEAEEGQLFSDLPRVLVQGVSLQPTRIISNFEDSQLRVTQYDKSTGMAVGTKTFDISEAEFQIIPHPAKLYLEWQLSPFSLEITKIIADNVQVYDSSIDEVVSQEAEAPEETTTREVETNVQDSVTDRQKEYSAEGWTRLSAKQLAEIGGLNKITIYGWHHAKGTGSKDGKNLFFTPDDLVELLDTSKLRPDTREKLQRVIEIANSGSGYQRIDQAVEETQIPPNLISANELAVKSGLHPHTIYNMQSVVSSRKISGELYFSFGGLEAYTRSPGVQLKIRRAIANVLEGRQVIKQEKIPKDAYSIDDAASLVELSRDEFTAAANRGDIIVSGNGLPYITKDDLVEFASKLPSPDERVVALRNLGSTPDSGDILSSLPHTSHDHLSPKQALELLVYGLNDSEEAKKHLRELSLVPGTRVYSRSDVRGVVVSAIGSK